MFQPIVSIIIPTYNRANIIHETLNSVINQTYSNWECIIVDDGSNDDTISVVEHYCEKDNRFKSFVRPVHKLKGPSSCRNYGIEKAKGAYVIFLDSDDLLAPFCLEERIKAFEANKKSDFLVFKAQIFKTLPKKLFPKHYKVLNNNGQYLLLFLRLYSVWQTTAPIYRIDFIKTIEGFNEQLRNYEDLELAIKAIFKTSNYIVFDNVDYFYRNDVNYSVKYKTEEIKLNIIKAFIIFLKSIDENVIRRCVNDELKILYKNEVVLAYKKVFILSIKDNIGVYKKQNKEILSFLSKNNYLNLYQKVVFYFVQNFLSKFYKIKRIGLYRFMKYLYQ